MKWGRNQADRNHYLGHSYVFLIAGRLGMDMPKAKLEFFNRGISGNKVSDLKARWQKDAINLKPDLLSILVGTNDVGMGFRHPKQGSYARSLSRETTAISSKPVSKPIHNFVSFCSTLSFCNRAD